MHALEAFGPDRLMFGSDWPVCYLAGDYQRVWDAMPKIISGLSKNDHQNIFGGNAIKFYRLKIRRSNESR